MAGLVMALSLRRLSSCWSQNDMCGFRPVKGLALAQQVYWAKFAAMRRTPSSATDMVRIVSGSNGWPEGRMDVAIAPTRSRAQ
jgi:hypothetical protein